MNLNRYTTQRITDYFGENTFSFQLMKQHLAPAVYAVLERSVQFHEPLGTDVADEVAIAMKDWALRRNVSAYTHWFQPLTGLTAEKHDSFLAVAGNAWLEEFTGSRLIKSEPDASSFPHGGMRSTFEARGYAAWDPSSPAFIMEGQFGRTLYIPSVFVSYDGYVLDKKTPLLKSMNAVSAAALRLLQLLGGNGARWVYPQVGAEQEYFLVDRRHAEARPDLRIAGYTLFGERAPKGQQFGDHYFGAIRERVLAFMQELEIELYRLGIPAKTRHNEVAPNQFELACLHEVANIAADHNHLVMELLRRVGRRHGLTALLHEKPFARINGSGKHNNWSLVDSEGFNMFSPGDNPADNLRFLCFVTAVLDGVSRHGDLLRAIIASPGNDFRLGSHEAPPAIMSVFLGTSLSEVFEQLAQGQLAEGRPRNDFRTGVPFIPPFPADATDRNRTSPFAFTGNKFEFRAVGSSASIAMPNAVLNTLVADGLNRVADAMERYRAGGLEAADAALQALREIYAEARRVHYEGDNYQPAWIEEARRRELPMAAHTPAALEFLETEKNLALFETYHVLRREELLARQRVKLETYAMSVELELRIARNMIRTLFLPRGLQYERELAETVDRLQNLLGREDESVKAQREYLRKIASRLQFILQRLTELDGYNEEFKTLPLKEQARFCAETVRPALAAVRGVVDELEERVDAGLWPIPRYWEMLGGL
jgi:glutamine synthetase